MFSELLIFFNSKFSTSFFNLAKLVSFSEADFNNDVHYRLVDQYVGFQYKTMFGDLILKPGLFYHYYLWQVTQFADEITNETKPVLLPEFESEYKLNSQNF